MLEKLTKSKHLPDGLLGHKAYMAIASCRRNLYQVGQHYLEGGTGTGAYEPICKTALIAVDDVSNLVAVPRSDLSKVGYINWIAQASLVYDDDGYVHPFSRLPVVLGALAAMRITRERARKNPP